MSNITDRSRELAKDIMMIVATETGNRIDAIAALLAEERRLTWEEVRREAIMAAEAAFMASDSMGQLRAKLSRALRALLPPAAAGVAPGGEEWVRQECVRRVRLLAGAGLGDYWGDYVARADVLAALDTPVYPGGAMSVSDRVWKQAVDSLPTGEERPAPGGEPLIINRADFGEVKDARLATLREVRERVEGMDRRNRAYPALIRRQEVLDLLGAMIREVDRG